MGDPTHQLAQLNIARARAPLDDPVMEGFVSRLEEINALADRTNGFVWRLQTDDGNATGIRVGSDPLLIVNMSVWESVGALYDYLYRSDHLSLFRNRAAWFEKPEGPILVLWWIPCGTFPRIEEGMARLKYLRLHGPTRWAFTFKQQFPPPGDTEAATEMDHDLFID